MLAIVLKGLPWRCLWVFDDRKSVKRMRVKKDLFVFDVNQHDEEF